MSEPEPLALVRKRADFLAELADRPLQKRELVEELRYSRATVNRAVAALADAGLVRDTPAGYEPTLAGALAVDTYREFVATEADVLDAASLLGGLDHDAAFPVALLRDADRFPASDHGTYANFEHVRSSLVDADAVDVVVPTARALPALDHWQDALVAADETTVLLDEALYESVRDDHRTLPWLADQGVEVLAGETPEFALGRVETGDGASTFALVYDDAAEGFGALLNDSQEAVDWTTSKVEAIRDGAAHVGDEFETGVASIHSPRSDESLPQVLEAARERFAEAESLANDIADTYIQAVVYRHLGTFERVHGDAVAADEHLEASRDLAESVGADSLGDRLVTGPCGDQSLSVADG